MEAAPRSSAITGKPSRASATRRRDQIGEREMAGAVFLFGERQARDRARHTDRQRRVARLLRIGIAARVEETMWQ